MDTNSDIDVTYLQFSGRRRIEDNGLIKLDTASYCIVRLFEKAHDRITDILIDKAVILADDRSHLTVNDIGKSKILFGGHHLGINGETSDITEQDSKFAALGIAKCKIRKVLFSKQLPEFLRNKFVVELFSLILFIEELFEILAHLVDFITDLTKLVF